MVGVKSRQVWDANPPTKPYYSVNHTDRPGVVVHHTAGELNYSFRRLKAKPGLKWYAAKYRANRAVKAAIKAYDRDDARLVELEIKVMKAIQRLHQIINGWSDIGYHIIIFPSGNAYEGRPLGVGGAHTIGHNTKIGICFAGNFEKERLTPQAEDKYRDLISRIKPGSVAGHYKYNPTACPGKNIKQKLGV